ncbi:UNVERIFIED_CONTAM: hypothetical protein FKN15_068762 [Acipenser sinensis]
METGETMKKTLDALDVREVLVDRERTSGEEQATRKRETGRAGNIWAGPEYCAGKARLQEGAAVIQQPPVSHGRDTGRSAFLDALDVREVLVERERTSGEKQATRKRETGRAGNIWADPEYCAGKDSEPVEQDGDPGRAASDGWGNAAEVQHLLFIKGVGRLAAGGLGGGRGEVRARFAL